MDQDYYQEHYRQYCINELAKQSIDNGIWARGEGKIKAQEEQDEWLKEGVGTQDNYLYEIVREEDNKIIGEIWFGIIDIENKKECFLFDIQILDEEQHKGNGKESLIKIEDEVLELGYRSLRLHVFKNNPNAIKLYKDIGYKEFESKGNSIWMEKEIKGKS